LTNPYTGTSWGNAIPGISEPDCQAFLQFLPRSNHGGDRQWCFRAATSFVSGQTANYYVNQDESTKRNQVDARGDQYFGSNQKVLLWGPLHLHQHAVELAGAVSFPGSTTQNKQAQIVTS